MGKRNVKNCQTRVESRDNFSAITRLIDLGQTRVCREMTGLANDRSFGEWRAARAVILAPRCRNGRFLSFFRINFSIR